MPQRRQSPAIFLGLGGSAVVVLLLCIGAGWLVDDLLGTHPVFILLGVLGGIVAAWLYAYVLFRKFMNR